MLRIKHVEHSRELNVHIEKEFVRSLAIKYSRADVMKLINVVSVCLSLTSLAILCTKLLIFPRHFHLRIPSKCVEDSLLKNLLGEKVKILTRTDWLSLDFCGNVRNEYKMDFDGKRVGFCHNFALNENFTRISLLARPKYLISCFIWIKKSCPMSTSVNIFVAWKLVIFAETILDNVKTHNGIVVVCHPFWG